MADLTEIQSSDTVKIVGSDATGLEQTPVASTTAGAIHTNLRNNAGTEIGTASNAVRIDPIGTTAQPVTDNAGSLTIDTPQLASTLGQKTMALSASVTIASDQTDPTYALLNAALPTKSQLVSGSDGTYSVPLAVDSSGRLITSSLTGFGADFAFGDVTTTATTRALVKRTTYTEQTTNAQRSIASASANDTAAGTGARTVKITYLTATGTGPFTETVTLNGTSYVNTVATDICFIEQIEVITAGSTGSNVGIITLKAATAGGGATIGTINATDNQTFWCHHYVPVSKTCNVTGISAGHNGTTVGSGALFTLNAKFFTVTNGVEIQVSDFVRLYGQTSTFARSYTSPIKVVGPARLQMYLTPETASSTNYRAAFDFFEP